MNVDIYSTDKNTKHAEQRIESLHEDLTEFVKDFNGVLPGAISTSEQLHHAINNPEAYMREYVKNKLPEREGGFEIDKDARLATIKLPSLESIGITHARRAKAACDELPGILNVFVLTSGSEVTINKENKALFLSKFCLTGHPHEAEIREFVRVHEAFAQSFQALEDYSKRLTGQPLEVFAIRGLYNVFDIGKLIEQGEKVKIPNKDLFRYLSNWPLQTIPELHTKKHNKQAAG